VTTDRLKVKGVQKRFGATLALDSVDLSVAPGEIRAIVGQNGAGKSTLMEVIAGEVRPDAGAIWVDGVVSPLSPNSAKQLGIAIVHQELSLVPGMSVAENICMGDPPRTMGFVDRKQSRRDAVDVMKRLVDTHVDPDVLVGSLPLAQRQFVEVARAIRQNPSILILDEPTATLSTPEAMELFAVARRLASEGVSILFVSHRLPEVFALCEAITVLRDGRKVAEVHTESTSPEAIAALMVGHSLQSVDRPVRSSERAAPVLVVDGLTSAPVTNASFEVGSGEILGIGGLVGSGRSELLRALVGLRPRSSGHVEIRLDKETFEVTSYARAVRKGLAYVPEDRRLEGVAVNQTVEENIGQPSVDDLSRWGLMALRRLKALAERVVAEMGVRPPQPKLLVGQLSGGNQQKVALGKWLVRRPKVLVLDEPTRGVDIGAKADVHRLVRAAAADGAAVIVVSSDLQELLELSDRILVMRDGTICGELAATEASEEIVMRLATLGYPVLP
jgi:ABC-type sugar transport system ATPase subunit